MPETTEATPFVSVIVPFWGPNVGELAACARAILAQDFPRERLELIVVDNHQTPKPGLAAALPPGCILLHEPRPGSYAARNRGLSEARGEIVAFTDSDCRPAVGWLSAGVRALAEDPELGFVGGHVQLTWRGRKPNACEINDLCLALRQEDYITKGGFCATANLITRASVIARVGRFDDSVFSGADRKWGERASALGVRCAYDAGAVVFHPARATLTSLLSKSRRMSAQFLARNRATGRSGIALFILIAKDELLRAASRFVVIGKRWREFGIPSTGGAMAVSALIVLDRHREVLRLSLGGRPHR